MTVIEKVWYQYITTYICDSTKICDKRISFTMVI